MDKELLPRIEELANLLLTPSQIGDLLDLNGEQVAEFQNPWSETGKLYRKILAEKSRILHERILRLADVGSPSALEAANEYLRSCQIALD